MRAQYHLKDSASGLLAWDVRKLVELSKGLPVKEVPLEEIRELDESFWFDQGGDLPTCRKIAEHARLISEVDLSYPIILDPEGKVMDGMHRVCSALLKGMETIPAVILNRMPEPDFINIKAHELPYD